MQETAAAAAAVATREAMVGTRQKLGVPERLTHLRICLMPPLLSLNFHPVSLAMAMLLSPRPILDITNSQACLARLNSHCTCLKYTKLSRKLCSVWNRCCHDLIERYTAGGLEPAASEDGVLLMVADLDVVMADVVVESLSQVWLRLRMCKMQCSKPNAVLAG